MTARVVSWDWREQPNLAVLAAAVSEVSGGRMHVSQVDTGTDDYVIVISDRVLTGDEADAVYARVCE